MLIGKSNRDLDYCLAGILADIGYTPIEPELLIQGATKSSSLGVKVLIIDQLWRVSDSRVQGILETALRDSFKVTVPETGETLCPIRLAADRCLKKIEAKEKGLDPLPPVKVDLAPDLRAVQKESATSENKPQHNDAGE